MDIYGVFDCYKFEYEVKTGTVSSFIREFEKETRKRRLVGRQNNTNGVG